MLAFSVPKKQNACSFARQSIVKPFYSNSNASSNNTTLYQSPAPATANSDRNKCKKQVDKHDNKPFKIRTFSTKVNHKKSTVDDGVKMLKICAIEAPHPETEFIKDIKDNGFVNQVYVLEEEPYHHISHTRKDLANMKRKKHVSKQTSLFNEIQIFKKVTKTSLMFRALDLSVLDSLSHQPDIWLNQTKNAMEKQFLNSVIIISFRLLNMQPKKYEKPQLKQNYQRGMDLNQNYTYSFQTANYLKQLSDSQIASPFLNQSRVFYKTNSTDELNQLRSYLLQNNLTNFAGIIDTHSKYSETYNLYNLRGITNKQSCVIVIDEQETLRTQIPVFHGENVLFLTPNMKNVSTCGINEMIKLIKQIQYEPMQKEETSFLACKPCSQNPVGIEKENIHPNMENSDFTTVRHSNRITKQYSPIKSKFQFAKPKVITFPSSATMKFISLHMNDLLQRVHQSQQFKMIKRGLKQRRSASLSSRQGRNQLRNNSTQRATQKVIQQETTSSCKVELDGEFKQKMIKYVKILQNERIQRLQQTKRIKNNQIAKSERKENQVDDLQELTVNLTSRLKTKTPFQLVGDILKNNAHIARQIGKYLDLTKLLENRLNFQEKRNTLTSNSLKNTLQLMLYQL